MRIRHTRCEVFLSPYEIKESTTMFSPVTPSFSNACAPPRVSNQRTGKVFNVEVSPPLIKKLTAWYTDLPPADVVRDVKTRISSWLDSALLDHGVFAHCSNEQLKEGQKAVKIFHHPLEQSRLVVLTHQDALGFPSTGSPKKVAYLEQASERGTTVPISSENKNTLVAFINQLYADLGISGEIPQPVLNDITTFSGFGNKRPS